MKSNRVLLALFSVIGISVVLAAGPAPRFGVNKLTALMITCPDNFNLQCPSTVIYDDLAVTGGCPGAVSVTCNPPSGAYYEGTTTVSCTATDACNNMAHCSFTIAINDTHPPSITCPADLNFLTTGSCLNVEYARPEASDNCLPSPTVTCAPASGTCFGMGTTTVTCTATDASGNTGSCAFTVTVTTCSISCGANITATTAAGQCRAIVNYPSPVPAGGCGSVTCSPPSGSFFAVGATLVNCTIEAGIACSFTVTVKDPVPPVISCPSNVTSQLPPGMANAVVNYQQATATDRCGVAEIACLPPSGAVFPPGTTTVTCTAKDRSENTATCSFTVTLTTTGQPLSIHCPSNIMVEPNVDQTSAIVTYPAPAATGGLPGGTVTCAPPSGSIFGAGSTSVTCTAIDPAGHRASCDFRVQVDGGVRLIIPDAKSLIELGTPTPVEVKRKSKKAKGPCNTFTIENTSFASLPLTLDAVNRTGGDVDGQHISDPREADLYVLSVINAGSETPLQLGETVTLASGERTGFCLRVNLTVPGLVGATTNLSATQVIPDLIDTQVIFRQPNGPRLILHVRVHVETAVRFINPNDPRREAIPSFTISGNEFEVTFAVFDPNLDLNRAKYEFLDAGGAVVAGPFEIDLMQSLLESHLVRGQSFAISQRFTGASSHPEAKAVRVTIFDGETSVTSPVAALGAAANGVGAQSQKPANVELGPVIVPDKRNIGRGRSLTQ